MKPTKFTGTVQGFNLFEYEFKYLEDVNEKYKNDFFYFMKEEIFKYPTDLYCNTQTNFDNYKIKLISQGTSSLDSALEEYKRQESKRMAVSEYLGQINPISFVGLKDGGVFGGIQVYGIKILKVKNKKIYIKCSPFPITGELFSLDDPNRSVFLGLLFDKLLLTDFKINYGFKIIIDQLSFIKSSNSHHARDTRDIVSKMIGFSNKISFDFDKRVAINVTRSR